MARLHLSEPIDIVALKSKWLAALESAETFVRTRPPPEVGCPYYTPALKRFVDPERAAGPILPHFGRPGGVLPRILESTEE